MRKTSWKRLANDTCRTDSPKDYPAIVDWALALKEKDRLAVLKALQETDYHPLFSGEDAHDAFSLSKVVCARNYTEQNYSLSTGPKSNQTS